MISIHDREKIKNEFSSLVDLDDLARFLNTTKRQLIYYSVILPEDEKYRSFTIPKKNGGAREINAPVKTLKYIQSQLSLRLQVLYEPLNVVHGFLLQYQSEKGIFIRPTIVSNATMHVRKKFILNIDLENFFPTISKKRVYGLFKNQYSLNSKIASYLTFICCTEKGLPQGAPTSPIITNMICSRLDRKLRRLSSENYVTYSRYADDLSFSTSKKVFPPDFEHKVNEIIKNEGFTLNEKKRRLLLRENRLEVTGLTVNLKPNVQRRYVRNLRAIFHSIKKYGIQVTANSYVRIKNIPVNNPEVSLKKFLNGKIQYLGQVKGKEDPIYIKFKQKFLEVFESEKMSTNIPESESGEFIYDRNELLKKYNAEIVDAIKGTSIEIINIRKRIEKKLDKAMKILLSEERKNCYETLYLMWYSCLNEFQRIHFEFRYDKENKKYEVYLDSNLIDDGKYFKDSIFSLPGHRFINTVTLMQTKTVLKPRREDEIFLSVHIYLFDQRKGEYIPEFSWLNEIRNRLNLTHSDNVNIKRDEYFERVDWIQCSWMFQLLYFIFTSKKITPNSVFMENKYLNKHNSGDIMKITGTVENIIIDDKLGKVELIILFGNDVSTAQHKIKAEVWKTFKDLPDKYSPEYITKRKIEAEEIYKNYSKRNIQKGDKVSLRVEYYLSNDQNKIRIVGIEKLPALECLAVYEKNQN